MQIERSELWIVTRFAEAQEVLSWAVVGGGRRRATTVANRYVRRADLPEHVDPEGKLVAWMAEAGLQDAVGMMTATRLDGLQDVTRTVDGVTARALVTAGLGNRLRAGDPPTMAVTGTINTLVHVDQPLSEAALVEALGLVVEAKTVAVLEAGLRSAVSDGVASGTGTDCVVVACPPGGREPYAGKHTAIGAAVGAAVLEATRAAVARWMALH